MGGQDAGSGPSALVAPGVTFLAELAHVRMKGPARVAVSPNTDVVVADPRGRAVHVFTAGGAYKFGIHRFARPLSCAVGADGRIFVGDRALGSVQIFDSWGRHLGALGKGQGEFRMPNDIAVDRAGGTVYVVDSKAHQVRAFSPGGTFKFVFGSWGEGDGQLNFPTGIHVDEAQKLVFVAGHNNGRISVFDRVGTFVRSFGSYGAAAGQFARPQGLTLDDKGRLYVVDAFQGRLQVVDTHGLHIGYLGQPGRGRGRLLIPLDAVFDAGGRLLVTSYDTGRVLLYGIDGANTAPRPEIAARVVFSPVSLAPPSAAATAREATLWAYVAIPQRKVSAVFPHTVRLFLGDKAIDSDRFGSPKVGDGDGDGVEDLAVPFNSRDVRLLLGAAGTHKLMVTGELASKETFKGWADLTLRP